MTETEWLVCESPEAMIRFTTNLTSLRKERLFATACCRRVERILDDYCRDLLTRVESLADFPLSSHAHNEVVNDAMAHTDGLSYRMGTPAGCALWQAAGAIWCAADCDNAIGAAYGVANAVHTASLDPGTFDVTRRGSPPEVGDPVERLAQAVLFRDIFGNPFRPVAFSPEWRSETAVILAQQMYELREFSAMPILADALQDAGCDNDDIFTHCRDTNQVHVRGCWVVDLVLGKQ